MDIAERFFAKVRVTPEDHWLWTAATDRDGYGRFWFRGRSALAYRVSYLLQHGEIPAGLHIDHVCRVRLCVNPFPKHTEAVTQAVNNRRQADAIEQCPAGHQRTPENTYHRKSRFGRECRTCVIDRVNQRSKTHV